MSNSNKFKETLRENRGLILAILMMPVIGMVIAIPLIIWKSPKSMILALGVIFFLIVQYLVMVLFIYKKMNQLIE